MRGMFCFCLRSVLFFVILASVKSEDDYLTEDVLLMDENDGDVLTLSDHEEYIRRIYSLIHGYKSDKHGGRFTITTNARIDTNVNTMWKRNADIINSLLGLPKGMNDAGR